MDFINFLFYVEPSTNYAFVPYLLSLYGLLLLAELILLVYARTRHAQSRELKSFWLSIPTTLFYYVLTGLFLVVLRLSDVPFISMGIWHVVLFIVLYLHMSREHKKFKEAERISVRRAIRREEQESNTKPKDPYIEAQFSSKKKGKKKK